MSGWKCSDCGHLFTEYGWRVDYAVVAYGSTYERIEHGDPCCPECGSEDYEPCAELLEDD